MSAADTARRETLGEPVANRDLVIARLADELAEGETVGGVSMWHVYSETIDEDPLDLQDQLTLLHGAAEDQESVRERMKEQFRKLASHYLQTSARGIQAVDDEIERHADEADVELERSAA